MHSNSKSQKPFCDVLYGVSECLQIQLYMLDYKVNVHYYVFSWRHFPLCFVAFYYVISYAAALLCSAILLLLCLFKNIQNCTTACMLKCCMLVNINTMAFIFTKFHFCVYAWCLHLYAYIHTKMLQTEDQWQYKKKININKTFQSIWLTFGFVLLLLLFCFNWIDRLLNSSFFINIKSLWLYIHWRSILNA